MGNACTKAGKVEAALLKAAKDGDVETVVHVGWDCEVQSRHGCRLAVGPLARLARLRFFVWTITVCSAAFARPLGPSDGRRPA